MPPATSTPEWNTLERHAEKMRGVHLRDLFENDPQRFKTFCKSVAGQSVRPGLVFFTACLTLSA